MPRMIHEFTAIGESPVIRASNDSVMIIKMNGAETISLQVGHDNGSGTLEWINVAEYTETPAPQSINGGGLPYKFNCSVYVSGSTVELVSPNVPTW